MTTRTVDDVRREAFAPVMTWLREREIAYLDQEDRAREVEPCASECRFLSASLIGASSTERGYWQDVTDDQQAQRVKIEAFNDAATFFFERQQQHEANIARGGQDLWRYEARRDECQATITMIQSLVDNLTAGPISEQEPSDDDIVEVKP